MGLNTTVTRNGNTAELCVVGEVDVSNAAEVREAASAVLAEGVTALDVNIKDVPYIDSTGIGVLVGLANRAQEEGVAFAVTNPQRNVARVLGLLGVDGQLNITGAE